MSFSGLKADAKLILTNVEAENDEEIIRKLCEAALELGYVNELFIEKIIEREREYPTGLPTEVPIAIPHVHDGCISSFFSLAVLKEPVDFAAMDGSEEKIKARLVFLFGITDPSEQVTVLKKFCEIFQDSELLRSFMNISEEAQLLLALKECLGDYIIL